jgi:hypothetical protein
MATGWVALSASAVVQADQTKIDAKFCAALASFHADVISLNALGPNATVGELRASEKRVYKDVNQMRTAAYWKDTPASNRFVDAVNQLDKNVNNVPDSMTVQQARSKIEADIQNAQTTGQEVAAEAGCPQP